MLPSNPRIHPVKGGVLRDRITSNWGNGVVSELYLPQGNTSFSYQNTGPLTFEQRSIEFNDVFGKIYTDFGPYEWFACGHTYDKTKNMPSLLSIDCDSMFAFQVVDEELSTDDFITWQSIHGTCGNSNGDWLRDPQPVIMVNGSPKTELVDYFIDYENGRVVFPASIRGITELSAQANSGSSTITVTSSQGFEAGDCMTIGGENPADAEICSVSEVIDSTTIALGEVLLRTHDSGSSVVENPPSVRVTYRYIEQHNSKQRQNLVTPNDPNSGMATGFVEVAEKMSGSYGIIRVKNPAFLNWDDDDLDSWILDGAGVGSVSKVQSSLFGNQSVQLNATANTGWKYLKKTINATTSGDLILSCWVNTAAKARIEIIPSDGQGVYTILDVSAGQPMTPFSGKWVRLETMCHGSAPFEIRLYAQASANDAGVARFDGVYLTEI